MSKKIVQLNEEIIKSELKELVRGSVEETLNDLLDNEADVLEGMETKDILICWIRLPLNLRKLIKRNKEELL